MRWSEVADVRTAPKCLMRQTDNSDNSAGDRIENSTTEITWSGRSVKAARGNFICDRVNAKYIDVSRRKREFAYVLKFQTMSIEHK